ncbi:MAG TPA: AMP-binding protein [Thermoleophilaceae bacterium]
MWAAACRAYDKALDDWLSLRARTHADHPALIAEGRSITYAQLADCRAPVRAPLVQEARGTHRFVARLWAAWQSGMPFVPLDPRLDAPPAPIDAPPGTRTVIFTSGTTGRPKPVYLTAANHEASAIASAWHLGVAPGDRWLCCLPLWHVGGLAIPIRSAIYGTTAVLHDGFDAARVREEIESGGVTLVSLVGTMLRRLVDAGLREWPALRAALVGGGPVPRDLADWAAEHGFPMLETYGMTETCSQVVTGGRPLLGVELSIAAGGEIVVRGPMVAPGALAADGWLHTGDRGRLGPDGALVVEGRLDDVIVTGGENVAAAEVEDALVAHPAVADAAVAGRPDPEWGQAVTAYVVLAADASDGELLAHCRERLAPFKVPKAIHRRDELPRNAAGKLLRRALAD